MCFTVPAEVVALAPGQALVQRGDAQFWVLLHLIEEPVAVGDFLAIQAQRQAVGKLTAQEAADVLAFYDQLSGQGEGGASHG